MSDQPRTHDPLTVASDFYGLLRAEVTGNRAGLDQRECALLQQHYPVMMNPARYAVDLAAAIYARRRAHAVQAILEAPEPVVLDAGCGFGSESFLFAALGAQVLAVDISEAQIAVARKRQHHYEQLLGRPLNITFSPADLTTYTPPVDRLSLTWLASILAAIPDQDGLLRRIFHHTQPGGKLIITDMNLLNPLFAWGEWRRRRRAMRAYPEFAQQADFLAMVRRRERAGARYFTNLDGGCFDDVQFFTARTLSRLIRTSGFEAVSVDYAGFIPPPVFRPGMRGLEQALGSVPAIRSFGYFYTVTGRRV
jgi:SAM-dependent methyltransferase